MAGHHSGGITTHCFIPVPRRGIWPSDLISANHLLRKVCAFLCFALNSRGEASQCAHLPHYCFLNTFRFLPDIFSVWSPFLQPRTLCKYFYCNSGGHSIGSIEKDAARWTGAMGRVEFSPPHSSPGRALPSFLLPSLLGAALCLWVKRKLQPHHRGQQHGSAVREALVTMNKQWNAFFLKLLIPLGISELSVGNIHLVKKWCHLWH